MYRIHPAILFYSRREKQRVLGGGSEDGDSTLLATLWIEQEK